VSAARVITSGEVQHLAKLQLDIVFIGTHPRVGWQGRWVHTLAARGGAERCGRSPARLGQVAGINQANSSHLLTPRACNGVLRLGPFASQANSVTGAGAVRLQRPNPVSSIPGCNRSSSFFPLILHHATSFFQPPFFLFSFFHVFPLNSYFSKFANLLFFLLLFIFILHPAIHSFKCLFFSYFHFFAFFPLNFYFQNSKVLCFSFIYFFILHLKRSIFVIFDFYYLLFFCFFFLIFFLIFLFFVLFNFFFFLILFIYFSSFYFIFLLVFLLFGGILEILKSNLRLACTKW